jgi:osmoprotectant transport system substrate-binding protein
MLAVALIVPLAACQTTQDSAPSEPLNEVPVEQEPAVNADAGEPDEAESDIGVAAGGPVTIGSKNFTEAVIVAELYAQVLEEAGFEVERKLNLGATDIAHESLVAGHIDLYPEYTSTGALTVLKLEPMTDKDEILRALREGYEEQFDLVWLDPAPFNNPQALATRADVADEYGIATYSDLAAAAPELVMGGPPEFFEREDGLPGLQAHYGGFEFKDTRQLDAGLRYKALTEGDIDVVLAFGTDGQISGYDLVLLEDDMALFPPYQVAPVVRQDKLDTFPDIATVLNALAPVMTSEEMQRLNWMVDGPDKLEPEDVARQFLQEQGFIE